MGLSLCLLVPLFAVTIHHTATRALIAGKYNGLVHRVKRLTAFTRLRALRLPATDGPEQLTATVSEASAVVASSVADRAVWTKQNPDPQGTGFGSAKVDAKGTVKLKGKLGDGTRFTQSVDILENGTWPFYLHRYKTGLFTGSFTEPGTKKPRAMSGALLQDKTLGADLFLDGMETGSVPIEKP